MNIIRSHYKKITIAVILFVAVVGVVYTIIRTQKRASVTPATLSADSDVGVLAEEMKAIPRQGVVLSSVSRGLVPLNFTIEKGVKVFNITAQPVLWPLLKGVTATAWSYNGMVPGPLIKVTYGDRVKILVKNTLPEPTTIHWHGIEVPNAMDGIPDVTQPPIKPGETFTYEFVAKPAGTYWYHSHYKSDKQISIGLSGAFIIEPKQRIPLPTIDRVLMLNEWRIVGNQTYAAMPASNMDGNYFTINGKSYPDTETITAKVGEKVRLRIIGSGQMIHPMHLHGFTFKIVATDGQPVPPIARLTKDTVTVAPGERYDIEFTPDRTGKWMFHCHIPHHTTNNHQEPGGLMMMINVI